jgi:hypothetical protein
MNNTTHTKVKVTADLTLESIREAVEKLKPFRKQWIEVSKKHYKQLAKMAGTPENQVTIGGSLYGIPVHIRPYLKKVRLYTEKTLQLQRYLLRWGDL